MDQTLTEDQLDDLERSEAHVNVVVDEALENGLKNKMIRINVSTVYLSIYL